MTRTGRKKEKTTVISAAHKFMGQKELIEMEIEFCGLPYSMDV